MKRGCGLLVHITSLPSKYGIGTFGSEAKKFVRFLNDANQKYWQILPLNPTSFGDSPYQSFSAFALNPYFIDLEELWKKGYITKRDLNKLKAGENPSEVNYGLIYEERFNILHKAFKKAYLLEEEKVLKFFDENKSWIEDYALFMTIKKMHKGKEWLLWKREYRLRNKKALAKVKEDYKEDFYFYVWMQYEAFLQYTKLRKYANNKGVKIIGDMPIYVALDSADCWGNPSMFLLDKNRRPTKVAGVPPDCFSATGQLWGNPLYDYEKMKKDDYRWWKSRVNQMAKLYDVVRIDHFRGFVNYWAIPANETTAINGSWELGPGYDFFKALEKETKKVQIIAEDLGILTPDVFELKDKLGFPGMKIMQFAFDDYRSHLEKNYSPENLEKIQGRLNKHFYNEHEYKLALLMNQYLPHNYETNCVGYIGTHDNDIQQNFIDEHQELQQYMLDYLNLHRVEDINDTLIGSLMRSCADVVIFMPQDILHLGKETRINTPGTTFNNWKFRFVEGQLNDDLANHLKIMVGESNR